MASVLLDADFSRALVAAPALHPLDLVLLEQELDAFGVLVDDFFFARQHVGPVDLHPADFKTQFSAIFDVVVDIRVMQQHFGGNAADVQAGAAQERVLLDDNRLQAKFARANRSNVTARTAPDDRHIVLSHS